MTPELKSPTAYLSWKCVVKCPKCGEKNDLAAGDHDGDGYLARVIFNNQWDKAKGFTVTCEHCDHGFQIEGVEV